MQARTSALGFKCALAFAALTLALQYDPGLASALQFSRPAFEQGALWQLVTAQWVHLNWMHAATNAAVAALMLVIALPRLGLVPVLVAWWGGYLGVAATLWADSNCDYYAGASGALHGLMAGCIVTLLWRGLLCGQSTHKPTPCGQSTHKPTPCGQSTHKRMFSGPGMHPRSSAVWGGMAALVFLAKLWVQHATSANPEVAWLGFVVYTPAHEGGAVGGGLSVLVWLLWQSSRRVQTPPHKPPAAGTD